LGAYPIVQITPYGETPKGFWLTNLSDASFAIVVGEPPTFDLVFAWSVEASKSGVMSFSDNTSVVYDQLTGTALNVAVAVTSSSISTSTAATTTSRATTSTIQTATSSVSMSSSTQEVKKTKEKEDKESR